MKFLDTLSDDVKTLIIISLIIVFCFVLSRLLNWMINGLFRSETKKLTLDPTMLKFSKNAVSLIIWLFGVAAIIYTIPRLRAVAITLFAGAGIFMAILGLAAQQAFSNIISGIFIVIFKPFRVGDMIKVGSYDYGIVEDITLRHTVINNFENKRIIIPNSVISAETVINDTIGESKICRYIEIGISYDSDIDKAMEILREEIAKHPRFHDNRTKSDKAKGVPKVRVRHVGFGDSAIKLRAYAWTTDPVNAIEMHSDVNIAVKKRFDAEGIEIPFPYQTVVFKEDIKPAKSPS